MSLLINNRTGSYSSKSAFDVVWHSRKFLWVGLTQFYDNRQRFMALFSHGENILKSQILYQDDP
jgi:hypothetical protein